jgi:hypothetical protein
MYWHRYIVAECVVVENVDCEEEGDVYKPALYRDAIWLEEEGGAVDIELRGVADRCDE